MTTVIRPGKARDKVLEFIRRETDEGRQAYVVYPVIEESEKTDLKAATTMFRRLSEGAFAGKRVALLHGRVPTTERDSTMRAFRDGLIDVLVATTVIEVGIDVPNAIRNGFGGAAEDLCGDGRRIRDCARRSQNPRNGEPVWRGAERPCDVQDCRPDSR